MVVIACKGNGLPVCSVAVDPPAMSQSYRFAPFSIVQPAQSLPESKLQAGLHPASSDLSKQSALAQETLVFSLLEKFRFWLIGL